MGFGIEVGKSKNYKGKVRLIEVDEEGIVIGDTTQSGTATAKFTIPGTISSEITITGTGSVRTVEGKATLIEKASKSTGSEKNNKGKGIEEILHELTLADKTGKADPFMRHFLQ